MLTSRRWRKRGLTPFIYHMQTGLVTAIVLLSLKIVGGEHLASEESRALELPEWHDAGPLPGA